MGFNRNRAGNIRISIFGLSFTHPMRNFLLIILSVAFFQVQGQYKRRLNPIFTSALGYPQSGWFWEAGLTYGYNEGKINDAIVRSTQDSLVVGNISPSSIPHGYIGVGGFTLINSPVINMIDYSIGFKGQFYNQDFEGEYYQLGESDAPPRIIEDEGRWSNYNVTLNFNFSHYFQVTEQFFIMPSLGLNGDFRVTGRESYSVDTSFTGYKFPKNINLFAHARISAGFKIHKELFIVPGIEAQLFNLLDFEQSKITQTYFNSEFLPLILSVKIMYHKPPRRKPCKVGVSDVDLNNTRRKKRKISLY